MPAWASMGQRRKSGLGMMVNFALVKKNKKKVEHQLWQLNGYCPSLFIDKQNIG